MRGEERRGEERRSVLEVAKRAPPRDSVAGAMYAICDSAQP